MEHRTLDWFVSCVKIKFAQSRYVFSNREISIGAFFTRLGKFLRTHTCHKFQSAAQPALHFGGAVFMKIHAMMSSCIFNRGTTVTSNNNVFCPADTKSIVQTHTFCTTLLDKNRQNRTFYNSVGG